ncbi:hypothetical protein IP70_13405 [alpha proteobacterium AAP38]|nr:hypothetical protein IP70_13405 [alpha proteobacterium AAP38]
MSTALIGHTGFVGGALRRAAVYDAFYNSLNIEDIRGRDFHRVVCAGVSAVKWWANLHPDQDFAAIERLIDCLSDVRCERFVLISTIDVYADPRGWTEADDPQSPDQHAYGRHRHHLEQVVRRQFGERAVIVRLPGLFGQGLKKNVLFDLLNGKQLEAINPDSSFQWYPVERLHADLALIDRSGLPLLNLVTEPVLTGDIQRRFFADRVIGGKVSPAASYDNRTLYPGLFGAHRTYHMDQEQVMTALSDFVKAGHGR